MDKFNRNYQLFIAPISNDNVSDESVSAQILRGGLQRGLIEIDPPLTIDFDIVRSAYASSNTANIRVYNLGQNTRSQIRKDDWTYGINRPVILYAGYRENLVTVFNGNLQHAFSLREGNNFITTIEAFDGGFAFENAQSSFQYNGAVAGVQTDQVSILGRLLQDLPGVSPGIISPTFSLLKDIGGNCSGRTVDLIREITGGGTSFFIDNGKAYCLRDYECLPGQILIIDVQSGLLNTPMREPSKITIELLFEPSVYIGQLIYLQSSTDDNFSGQYKILSIHHRGMISESVCGSATTTLELQSGKSLVQVA